MPPLQEAFLDSLQLLDNSHEISSKALTVLCYTHTFMSLPSTAPDRGLPEGRGGVKATAQNPSPRGTQPHTTQG